MPSFLLIGAAKSGTTSLWQYLAQHPEIFLPENKEPNYFAFPEGQPNTVGPAPDHVIHELLLKFCVTTWSEYVALFEDRVDQRVVGEASVRYLYTPESAQCIYERLPGVRLIAVLREPVSRLYSHYWMNRRFHLENLNLEDAIAAEPERCRAGWGYDWHYVGVGRYADQIERFLGRFGRDRLAVFLQDELNADPHGVYRKACRFLGVSEDFVPDVSLRAKKASRPRFVALDRLLYYPNPVRSLGFRLLGPERFESLRAFSRRWNSLPVPPLEREGRERLKGHFRDDLLRLEGILDQDLSAWR